MKLKLFILVLALQSAWMLGTTVVQERALAYGTVILLETRPVDPRDLLTGVQKESPLIITLLQRGARRQDGTANRFNGSPSRSTNHHPVETLIITQIFGRDV